MSGAGAVGGAGQYQKYLLNRLTANSQFLSFLQAAQARDDDDMKHTFHKIMVHNWSEEGERLFSVLGEYYGCVFVPVRFTQDAHFCFFYTDCLALIQKIIVLEFIFPHERSMYNVDVLFGDKTSADVFGARVCTEQLVAGVVSRRFSAACELDLSHFGRDLELQEKQIHVHSLGQLAAYKRLMLRLGRDTKILNLSNNNLSQVPQELINFMRGDLIGVNLSDNNIASLDKLPRMSSLLERLWLEGNPLCEAEDALSYVKRATVLFPRLQELDGVPINRHGFVFPFMRNYLSQPSAKPLTEKFLTLYFTHYDSSPRAAMEGFYHATDATLSISTSLSDKQLDEAKHFRALARNLLSREPVAKVLRRKLYPRTQIFQIFRQLPETQHDPATFTVDVLAYDKIQLVVCVDGVFKERREEGSASQLRLYQFRRTFYISGAKGQYYITNELLHVHAAADHAVQNAFNNPIRKLNELRLVEPAEPLAHALCAALQHLTHLNRQEVERRLKIQSWDLRKALLTFQDELKNNRIAADLFVDPALEDVSDDEVD